jgi:16S rRNA (adenine1518-N6/adenine1519-N6)-dimethyltransferase
MVSPKKHLGQHFLKDDNIARKIVDSLLPGTENVLEIGAGTGILTKHLIEKRFPGLYVIEIDRESVEYLNSNYSELGGKIINEDFLKYDLDKLFTGRFSIIGNFPYNISSQILFKVLEYRNSVGEVVGMFQKEVAERIASPPGSKKYGILSVLIKAFFDIEYLFTVNESVFYPPPKVKSAVIRLKRNKTDRLNCDEKIFFAMVKAGFNQRRKTLRNSLGRFNLERDDKVDSLLQKRAERLTVEDFEFLAGRVIHNE